jgi:hypothetical protein
MSFNLPSFVPNQISTTLRSLTDRGFQSPLNVALATVIPLIALYSTLPALSSGVPSKPKIYPSLGTIVVTENSRIARLKKHVDEIYPADIYGPGHTVELTKGQVRYWLFGPEEGKRVCSIYLKPIHRLTSSSIGRPNSWPLHSLNYLEGGCHPTISDRFPRSSL